MFRTLMVLLILQNLALASHQEKAKEILETFKNETNLIDRLDLISKAFVGKPYGFNGPLGEGTDGKYDQDPLYRFDTFDCTTYVESVIALAISQNVLGFEKHLDLIRYEDGVVDYLKRNHFTDLQWIPFNVRNGYLKEISDVVVPQEELLLAEAVINLPGWLKAIKVEQIIIPGASNEEKYQILSELRAQSGNYIPKVARVPYISIHQLLSHPSLLDKIPSGAVVNFVRPNWDLTTESGTHQNISHQGLLIRKDNVLYLRHAGSAAKKVDELPFINYLKPLHDHPTLKGIHLMKVSFR